ncbi:phage tail protein [Cellulosilyticum sp. I15G10I2]|uniref:phage tail protein n=1 Tax=Cellulosilyticum sp. I15G10I2 TaxID=1892843 RepID=UPI00085C5866|nr:phage tail protein [Cellulosilyticum sp. I15G10I2]
MSKDVFIDTKKIETLTIELKGFEKEVGEAAYHALNRTLDQVVTQVGRIVPKEYAIKAKEVKETFAGGIKRPSKSNLEASVASRGHTLSLAHFPLTPSDPKLAKMLEIRYGTPLKVKIKKSSGNKQIRTNPKPFLASTGAKSADKTQYNIFKRSGKSRLPIAPVRTLSIPQMITNENIGDQIQNFATEKLNERLQHEIERAMISIGGKLK